MSLHHMFLHHPGKNLFCKICENNNTPPSEKFSWHFDSQGSHGSPHFNFQTKKGPTVSVSNIRDIAFYGCLEIIRTRSFTIFTVYVQVLDNFRQLFIFSNYIGEIDHFTLDLLKRSDTYRRTFLKKFFIVDHPKEDYNEREFKRLIIGGILDQLEKS